MGVTAATVGSARTARAAIDPSRAGDGVVVQQGDDLAAGVTDPEVDAAGEPEVTRRADDVGALPAGDDRRLLAGRSVVDDDDLGRLGQRRRQAFGQPGSGALGDDDDR